MQPDPYPAFLNSISQCRPTSRGKIHIQFPDPFKAPMINPNYLATEKDCQEMLEREKFLRDIAQTPTLKNVINHELLPGEKINSGEELLDDIRNRSETVFHPTSTCMMGNNPDNSVVDAQLKVYGIDQLRVVDASIFPSVISGNTNGPTIMVTEKAADIILNNSQ